MTTQIKVLRKDFIKHLSAIKEDNIGIAGIVIDRRKLLGALKLQTQPLAEAITLTYGQLSWEDGEYKTERGRYNYATHKYEEIVGHHYIAHNLETEPCIEFSCDHTMMRFLSRPKKQTRSDKSSAVKHLNFGGCIESPKPTGYPVDTQALLDALTFVIHGVATDESRPVLACVLFDSTEEGYLTLATADGFRLPVARISANLPTDRVLIHSKDAVRLISWLRANTTGKGKHKAWLDTHLTWTKGKNENIEGEAGKVKFSFENGALEFDRQIGTYPNYQQLVPTHGTHIEVIASQMLEAVKALSTVALDGSGIIRLQFTSGLIDGKVMLSAHGEDVGESSVDCDAKVERDCKIAMNHKYLIEYLSVCGNHIIDLFITEPSSPMVCHDGTDKYEVIMPMYCQW